MGEWKLDVRISRNGRGAYAVAPFGAGDVVYDWTGCRLYTRDQLPDPYPEGEDKYLQVADDVYVGPYGVPDEHDEPGDFINHACDPNCRIEVDLPRIRLVALRPIRAGEEVTFDYAATMSNDPWTLDCKCGSPRCRGRIRAGPR